MVKGHGGVSVVGRLSLSWKVPLYRGQMAMINGVHQKTIIYHSHTSQGSIISIPFIGYPYPHQSYNPPSPAVMDTASGGGPWSDL